MYDSPVTIAETAHEIVNASDNEMDNAIKNEILKVVRKYSVHIDETKLIQALRADEQRYREAYRRGNEDGYKMALDEMNSKRVLEEVWKST